MDIRILWHDASGVSYYDKPPNILWAATWSKPMSHTPEIQTLETSTPEPHSPWGMIILSPSTGRLYTSSLGCPPDPTGTSFHVSTSDHLKVVSGRPVGTGGCVGGIHPSYWHLWWSNVSFIQVKIATKRWFSLMDSKWQDMSKNNSLRKKCKCSTINKCLFLISVNHKKLKETLMLWLKFGLWKIEKYI